MNDTGQALVQNGWALGHASEELWNDKEVVLEAVKQRSNMEARRPKSIAFQTESR